MMMCLYMMLIGLGAYGFQQSLGKASNWRSFLSEFLVSLQLHKFLAYRISKLNIVLSIKKGRRSLVNDNEIINSLMNTFPQHHISSVNLRDFQSFKEEVTFLRNVHVLITPCKQFIILYIYIHTYTH